MKKRGEEDVECNGESKRVRRNRRGNSAGGLAPLPLVLCSTAHLNAQDEVGRKAGQFVPHHKGLTCRLVLLQQYHTPLHTAL